MTPKEKAAYLRNKFMLYADRGGTTFDERHLSAMSNAKECAIICVLEIVSALPNDTQWQCDIIEDWQNVKDEIEKL